MKARVTAKLPPQEIPKKLGEAKGLWKRDCNTAPEIASEAPVQEITINRGILSSSRGFHVELPLKIRSINPSQICSHGVAP